jgi:hypothetical protein
MSKEPRNAPRWQWVLGALVIAAIGYRLVPFTPLWLDIVVICFSCAVLLLAIFYGAAAGDDKKAPEERE